MVAKESQAMRIGVLGINHQIKLIMLPRLLVEWLATRLTHSNHFWGNFVEENHF